MDIPPVQPPAIHRYDGMMRSAVQFVHELMPSNVTSFPSYISPRFSGGGNSLFPKRVKMHKRNARAQRKAGR